MSIYLYASYIKNECWRGVLDPKLANLLSELEQGLGSVIRHQGVQPSSRKDRNEDDVLGIDTTNMLVM